MGTTTFFLRLNDCAKPLHKMSKKKLAELNNTTPYDDKPYKGGWLVPVELHNGNVKALVFWKGRLMKLENAPKVLSNKYYDTRRGKKLNEFEWTMLKRYLLAEIEQLDQAFKKAQRKSKANGAVKGHKPDNKSGKRDNKRDNKKHS